MKNITNIITNPIKVAYKILRSYELSSSLLFPLKIIITAIMVSTNINTNPILDNIIDFSISSYFEETIALCPIRQEIVNKANHIIPKNELVALNTSPSTKFPINITNNIINNTINIFSDISYIYLNIL